MERDWWLGGYSHEVVVIILSIPFIENVDY